MTFVNLLLELHLPLGIFVVVHSLLVAFIDFWLRKLVGFCVCVFILFEVVT